MAGTISSLGVGSGLELQNILEQLREVDQEVVDRKQTTIVELESQLEEFTVVKNQLLTMKSSALDLSLSSNFLGRTVTNSDKEVLTATVQDGAEVQANTIVVSNMAAQSSWLSSSGAASKESKVYVPTEQESTTGTTLGLGDAGYITQDDSITITHGSGDTMQTITVAVTSGMSFADVCLAIREDDENGGSGEPNKYVTAGNFYVGTENFLRIKSTASGSGESHRVMITEPLSDVAMAAPDKVFSYQLGSDTAAIISIAADTTLTQLVDLINDDTDNPGTTASIINDGVDSDNPYRLVLKANSTGEDNRISFLAQLPDMGMSENTSQAAADSLNAQFTVDGISYQRQSNSVSDVFTGVEYTLIGAGTSSVSISSNDEALTKMINDLVEAYNSVSRDVSSKSSYGAETDEFGILSGTTLRDLPFELQTLMTSNVTADDDKKVETLFDLGLDFEISGIISVDQEILADAIKNNRSSVEAFFLGDSDKDIIGFADKVNDRLRFVTGGTGIIEGEKSAAKSRIDGLEESIEAETDRLDRKYEIMKKQFIELDTYMSRMTSMSSYLTSQFDSLSGLSTGSKSK